MVIRVHFPITFDSFQDQNSVFTVKFPLIDAYNELEDFGWRKRF